MFEHLHDLLEAFYSLAPILNGSSVFDGTKEYFSIACVFSFVLFLELALLLWIPEPSWRGWTAPGLFRSKIYGLFERPLKSPTLQDGLELLFVSSHFLLKLVALPGGKKPAMFHHTEVHDLITGQG